MKLVGAPRLVVTCRTRRHLLFEAGLSRLMLRRTLLLRWRHVFLVISGET
jgi:hypothetical protein